MTIVRWNPNHEVRFPENMTRAIDDFFAGHGPAFPWASALRGVPNVAWEPLVDIYETTDEVVVRAELPGMRAEDIEVTLEHGVLMLHGGRQADDGAAPENYLRAERRYGSFTRSFSLPGVLDPDKIRAEYTDGVLTVRLPKLETAKPRRIEIAA